MNKYQKLKQKHMRNLKFIDEYDGDKQTRHAKLFNSILANELANGDLENIAMKKKMKPIDPMNLRDDVNKIMNEWKEMTAKVRSEQVVSIEFKDDTCLKGLDRLPESAMKAFGTGGVIGIEVKYDDTLKENTMKINHADGSFKYMIFK